MWVGWVQVTGDGSGGDATAILQFDPAELTPNRKHGRFYNIEQLELSQSTGLSDTAQLHIINFSVQVGGAFTNRQMSVQLTANQGGNGAVLLQNALARPIFLGQAAQRGTTNSIRMVLDNVNSVVYVMWAEGYIWEGRSTQAVGGLRRPVDSLYGT